MAVDLKNFLSSFDKIPFVDGYETKRTLREARRSAEAVIIIRKKRTREAIIIGLAITV